MSNMRFVQVLNVRREESLAEMLGWALSPAPRYRLRSVVGAAGIGKSWFMADLYQELLRHNPRITVWWMNLSANPIHPISQNSEPDLHNLKGFDAWLTDVSGQSLSPDGDFSAGLEFALNSIPNNTRIILLVDGFDEIPPGTGHRDWVEEQVLAVAYGNERVRIILARRDDYGLTYPILRWNDDLYRLSGFKETQRRQQIAHRHAAREEASVPSEGLVQELLSPSLGENPFINSCLFEQIIALPSSSLTWEQRKSCAQRFSERAGLPPASFGLLERLVNVLPQEWTAKELAVYVGITIDDPGLEPLFQSGIVFNMEGSQRYRVDAGIYKLLKRSTQSPGGSPGPNDVPSQPPETKEPSSPPLNGIQRR